MKVLGIVGSARPDSRTAWVTAYVGEMLTDVGIEFELWDLGVKGLPFADPMYHHAPLAHPDERVREFATAVTEADGLLLASPVYHSSYTGLLKNAIDCLDGPNLAGKPVGTIAFGKNLTAIQVCNDLRTVLRSLWVDTLVTQVVGLREHLGENESGEVIEIDADLQQRCERMSREMTARLTGTRFDGLLA